MMVSMESAEGLKRKLRIEVPDDEIQTEITSRLKKVSKTAKLSGFRPGKVPFKVIQQRYGPQVRQEVLTEFMQSSYAEALQKENLTPAGNPDIEPDDSKSGLAYTASFEVLPEVSLKDLDQIKVERPDVKVGDADVNRMLENLQQQKGEWVAVDRKSKDGDRVKVDFDGTLKGEPIPNGKGEGVVVELGGGRMLPDFDKALTGVVAGQELTFKVAYPKDYPQEDLAGKKADFAASVHSVEALELPPIDDELAKAFGVEEGGVEQLRADVLDNMKNEAQQRIRADVKEQVMTSLLELNPLDIPEALVAQEQHTMQHEAMRQMGVEDHADAPPAENFKEQAEKRVKLGLLLHEFIRSEALSVDETRIRARIEEMFASYSDGSDSSQIVDTYMSNPQLRGQIEPMILEEQAIEKLIELGSETTKPVEFQEYMRTES